MSSARFRFAAHNFFITEQASNEIYILIRREMRTAPLPSMKMPTPHYCILGLDAVMTIKHKGQPAPFYSYKLYRNELLIQTGAADGLGMVYGLDVIYSPDKCGCRPEWFKNVVYTPKKKKSEPNYNMRCCKVDLTLYDLEITPSEPASFDEEGIKMLDDSLTPVEVQDASEGHLLQNVE